jgi:acyl-[acyl-carrier-protein]-phospholipid O-acyltransferase/long-chain-fatty-acid--[acyl-carrier-protein] ligase
MASTPASPCPPARWQTGFWSLIAVQSQGAFSDNFLRWTVAFLVFNLGLSQQQRDRLVVLIVPLLFSVPFLLFSMTGGYLADRFSKRSVTIATKAMEVAVALIALIGLAQGNLKLQLAAIFLIGTQAALFGPSKYGLLPEILPESRLSWGNGVLELSTFLAILAGTLAAGLAAGAFARRPYWAGVVLVALALAGLAASFSITRVAAARPAARWRWNPLGDLLAQMRIIRRDHLLTLAVLGNTYFWFLGALLLINVVLYGEDILHVSTERSSLLLVLISTGIGLGSLAAGYLSGGRIEYGLVPLGALGITAITAVLAHRGWSYAEVAGLLGGLGFFAGFFAVPVNALIQHRPPPEEKGGVIAAANLLSFVGIALQPVVQYALLRRWHPDPARVFLITAALTLLAVVCILVLQPDAFLRLLAWLATHSLYRVSVHGREHVPERGGVLLLTGGLSPVGVLLLVATTDRPLRFLIPADQTGLARLHPLLRLLGAVPVPSLEQPHGVAGTLDRAAGALRAGELVCIVAGQAGPSGQPLPFRQDLERTMEALEAPVVPVAVDGPGGAFGSSRGRFFGKWPRRIPYPVTVDFGAPLPRDASAAFLREVVQRLLAGS